MSNGLSFLSLKAALPEEVYDSEPLQKSLTFQ